MNRFSVSPPIDCFNGGGGLSHLGDGRQLNGSTITEKGGIRAFFQMDGAIPPKKAKALIVWNTSKQHITSHKLFCLTCLQVQSYTTETDANTHNRVSALLLSHPQLCCCWTRPFRFETRPKKKCHLKTNFELQRSKYGL